jgi:hypothetical protein
MIRKFKIKGLPSDKELAGMAFGRSLETLKAIEKFKTEAKSTHLSQKRQSYAKAIKDAIALYDVKEYFCQFECSPQCKDDTFQFWYK